ncbi:hypothetical protein MKX01_019269 [Papaver californicum]|nr:hypothetical protein MKX01_019269 [Papaver californicum]
MASDTQGTSKEKEIIVADDDNGQKLTNHVQRGQWLRAAILGANDGLLSTTSLMLGIGAVKEDRFSISNQDQISQKNFRRINLDVSPHIILGGRKSVSSGFGEIPAVSPSTSTYGRSLQFFSPGKSPMMRVISEDGIIEMKKHDEVNETLPNPVLAAIASAFAFLFGSFFPLATALLVKENKARTILIPIVTSIALALFGGAGARLGGSSVSISVFRVVVGGWIAMGISYGILTTFHVEDQESVSISVFRVVVGGWIAMGISYGILTTFHVEDQEMHST